MTRSGRSYVGGGLQPAARSAGLKLCGYVLMFCLAAVPAAAQTPPAPARGKLHVTVADPSGAVIPGAKVTIVSQEPANPANAANNVPADPVQTSQQGIAEVDGLAPGRYTIQAEFPGFETVQVRDVRVRAGDNRRSLTLPLKKVAEEVTVGRDNRSISLDPGGAAFSTILTRAQIEALPDDPEQMAQVLQAMAPPGATIRVDGFTGGRLPPKSQIRSIRLPRMDQYAAQNHGGMGGMLFIDIMTQPGNGPWRGSADFTFRDESMNAQNPFTPTKGIEELKQGGFSLSGTIVPNRSSFSFNAQSARQLDSGNLLATLPDSTEARATVQPTQRMNLMARFDQATTKDRMLRASYQRTAADRGNLGVGAYDLTERGYSNSMWDNMIRISENGPLGRQQFLESRLQVRWSDSEDRASVELPTVRVLDAFTRGGAQRSGGRRNLDFEAATDLDIVRGSHSYRVGVLAEGGNYRTDENSNYLGTYTFASLAEFDAGRPLSFTRRTGDPTIQYRNFQFGAYVQDDYRISRSVLVSYGVRYEAQTLLDDQLNFQPRASVAWSPMKSGRTTVRANWGVFNDWLGTSTYEQTLRFDGFRQQEINMLNPSYPNPGEGGTIPPTNRYFLSDGLILPESMSLGVGVDQAFTQAFRVTTTYTYRRGSRVLRGNNLNPLIDGTRPDPQFTNVIEVVGDADARLHQFGLNFSYVNLAWRNAFLHGSYTISSSESNTTGAFSPPPTGDLSTEWGQLAPRHRFGGMISLQPIRNLTVSANARAQSGMPYNITTGFDENGDGLFTDRPEGVERNSARTAVQFDMGMRVAYAIPFGTPRSAGGPGGGATVVIGGGGGGMPGGGFGGGGADRRFRVEFYASAQNVTNHYNYTGYSGVMTSEFFLQPTSVMNPRKVELGVRFGF
jgi:hypothetical protein